MPPPQFSVDEYVTKVRMSNQPTLLVEGPTDQRLFLLLLDSLNQAANVVKSNEFFIDTAAIISSLEVPTNREKVEKVTGMITSREFSSRFVGFIDREFGAFDTEGILSDNLGRHNQVGRLVWSRGHSIENYFFEYGLVREPLRILSDSIHFSAALDWMKERFQDVMNIACAVSLAARDIELLSMAQSIVDWNCFNSTDSSLILDSELWNRHLSSKGNLDKERIDRLIERFEHWLMVSRNSEAEVVRWICHGHIGVSVIWNAYARLMYDASSSSLSEGDQHQGPNIPGARGSLRFNQCASELAQQYVNDTSIESPRICFRMLGISI